MRAVGYLWFLVMVPEAAGGFRLLSSHCGAVANMSLGTWLRSRQGTISLSQEAWMDLVVIIPAPANIF